MDEAGQMMDEAGQMMDEGGQMMDEDGYLMDEDGNMMDEGGWMKWGWWIRVVFMEMLSFASWVSNDIHEAYFFAKQQTIKSLQ